MTNEEIVKILEALVKEVILPAAMIAAERAALDSVESCVRSVLAGYTDLEIRRLVQDEVRKSVEVTLNFKE